MFKSVIFSPGKLRILSLVFLVAIFLFFIFQNFLTIPPVWPDEAVAADSAYNLIHQNRIGTDLWKTIAPGTETLGYAYPPFYFYSTAAWFKLFGFSVVNLRLFSVALSICFLIVFSLLTKEILDRNFLTPRFSLLARFLIMGGLVLDSTFQKAARIGRPEMLVILLAMTALYFYLLSVKTHSRERLKNIYSFLSGIFVGFALLTHYPAGLYLVSLLLFSLIRNKFKAFRSLRFYFLFIPASVPILLWFISLYPQINTFLDILKNSVSVHNSLPTWFWLALKTLSVPERLTYMIYIIISIEFLFFFLGDKSKRYLLVTLILIFSWIATFIWKIEWGFVIIIPPVYIALFILLNEHFRTGFKTVLSRFNFLVLLAFSLISLNIIIQLNNMKNFPAGTFSYNRYTDKILKVVPDYKTVYISAIPDPYFGFKEKRHNTLYLFPMLKPEKSTFIKVLNSVDYVIYNQALDSIVVGDTGLRYIDKNTKQIYKIGEPAEYSTYIIELKSKDQRITDL